MAGRARGIFALVAILATVVPIAAPRDVRAAGAAPIAVERDGDLYSFRLGHAPRRLTASGVREHHPAWAPDHRRLAFAVWGRRVGTLDLSTGTRRILVRLPRRIDRIETIAWSPDGRRLAVAATNEFRREGLWHLSGTVWVVGADGRGAVASLTGQGLVSGLGWTPDGRRLFASTEWPNGVDLWRPDAPLGVIAFDDDGGDLRLVAETVPSQLDISSDGRRVVYRGWSRTCHACGEIWRMATDGSGGHVIAMPPDGTSGLLSPRFSPAGTRIAVVAITHRGALWIMRPDGSRMHRVLNGIGTIDW